MTRKASVLLGKGPDDSMAAMAEQAYNANENIGSCRIGGGGSWVHEPVLNTPHIAGACVRVYVCHSVASACGQRPHSLPQAGAGNYRRDRHVWCVPLPPSWVCTTRLVNRATTRSSTGALCLHLPSEITPSDVPALPALWWCVQTSRK